LLADGLCAATDAGDADLVVVNTCAFVEAARQESIEAVLTLGERRKSGAKLVVTGCMAERYSDELAAALPEVDAVVGFAGEGAIGRLVSGGLPSGEAQAVDGPRRLPSGVRDLLELPRAAPSVPWAYVKVAEGCDRACAFCAIPSFRGKQRSRSPEALLAESRMLVEGGVAELVLVAQDLAWYGRDVGETGSLAALLRRLDTELAPAGLRRIRLLYLYPSEVRDPLVEMMLELETVVPYFDLSLQHADRALLARMKRWGSGGRFADMIGDIRDREPDATFRSSFIVGFPGETEAEHDVLLDFLRDVRLDWAGFFAFSPEDGTPAATMEDRASDPLVREWLGECDEVQVPITEAARDALVRDSAEIEVLVDGIDDETGAAVGRTHREAPEIDGVVWLGRMTPKETEPAESTRGDGVVHLEGAMARPGVIVRAKVTEALGVDLHAVPIEVVA
jgi:ribosomal protein S12 methylthiotransferase